MNRHKLRKKVWECAGQLIAEKGYVSPVDLFVKMERLTPQQVEDWRFRRIPYLERVAIGNLSKMNMVLLALREFAGSAKLKPSLTVYKSWGKGPKQRLRFSKHGLPSVEEMYSTHYVAQTKKLSGMLGEGQDKSFEAIFLICRECGDKFIFEASEQKYFEKRGWEEPKRCESCREKKWLRDMGINPEWTGEDEG